jgi:hypothetical protein
MLPVTSREPDAKSQSRSKFFSKWRCSDEERGRKRIRLCKEAGCTKASQRGPHGGYCKRHAKEHEPVNSSLCRDLANDFGSDRQPAAQTLQPVARTLPPANEMAHEDEERVAAERVGEEREVGKEEQVARKAGLCEGSEDGNVVGPWYDINPCMPARYLLKMTEMVVTFGETRKRESFLLEPVRSNHEDLFSEEFEHGWEGASSTELPIVRCVHAAGDGW